MKKETETDTETKPKIKSAKEKSVQRKSKLEIKTKSVELISCGCGKCGIMIPAVDKQGRPRRYAKDHHPKPRTRVFKENQIERCAKPGCETTFLKYRVDKKGYTIWNRPRRYCSHSHALQKTENPLIECKYPTCNNLFPRYYVSRAGHVNRAISRSYCPEHAHIHRKIIRDNPIIKCELALCQNTFKRYPVTKKGITLWTRPRKYCCRSHAAPRGENNRAWKGEEASYSGKHKFIRIHYPPTSPLCEICGVNREQHLANISGKYTRNREDYVYACESCHNRYDTVIGVRKTKWVDFGQMCNRCGSRYVTRCDVRYGVTCGHRQELRCSDCRHYWWVDRSLLEQMKNV